MKKSERIEYWINLADYDLKTAKAMLESKRYLYVGFMCHQTIEKILKGLYEKLYSEVAPYTHNLLMLSEKCNLKNSLDEQKKLFLTELNPLNIENRYPEYKIELNKKLNYNNSNEILRKTRSFYKWIKEML